MLALSRARSDASRLSSTDCHQASSSSALDLGRRERAAATGPRAAGPACGRAVRRAAPCAPAGWRALRIRRPVPRSDVSARRSAARTANSAIRCGASGMSRRARSSATRWYATCTSAEPDRQFGHDAGGGEPLPQDALLLDAPQALVQVGDVHTRAHVLERELAEPATVGAGHVRGLAAGRGRGDQLGERAVVDGRLELVEGLAHVEEEAQVDAELRDGLEGAHPGLPDEGLGALDAGAAVPRG